MGETRKRHLYYDQQKPAEEPVDAAHARVLQEEFARQPPTTEDQYFFERERKLARHERIRASEKPPAEPPPAQVTRTGKLWERITRALSRGNTRWRP